MSNGKEQIDGTPAYDFFTKKVRPSCQALHNYTGMGNGLTDAFKTYAARIATFDTWPKSIPIPPQELAHAGFVYTGSCDKVHCPWCKLTLHQFEKKDKPYEEHVKHTKGCRYVQLTLPSKVSDMSNGMRSTAWPYNRS